MLRNKGASVGRKCLAPTGYMQPRIAAVWPADPWNDTKPAEFIQESFDLRAVYKRQATIWFCRAEMREYICDVMIPQSACKFLNIFRTPVPGNLCCPPIRNKPLVACQPAVRNPDAVVLAIISPVAHIQTRTPCKITATDKCEQTSAGDYGSPWRALDSLRERTTHTTPLRLASLKR